MIVAHQLIVQPRGFRLDVQAGETVLDALRRLRYQAPFSCRQAVCGVCRATVLSGAVKYADDIILSALSASEIEQGYALMCSAELTQDTIVKWDRVYAPNEIVARKITATVRHIVAFNDDTFRVCLRLPALDTPRFFAGQYLFIVMPDGERKPFSIASAPAHSPDLELHIRVLPQHAAADAVLKHLQAHSIVTLDMPYGRAIVQDTRRPIVMIAGGTGVSPMLSMIAQLRSENSTREVHLYWGAHDLNQLHCHSDLLQHAQHFKTLHYHPVLAAPNSAWHGATGLPHTVALQHHSDLSSFEIYLSGSLAMVKNVRAACLQHGAREDAFFCDLLDMERDGLLS